MRTVVHSLAVVAIVAVIALLAGCADPTAGSVASDAGPTIVFQDGNLIQLADLGADSATALAAGLGTGDQVHPDWSPDGAQVAFAANDDDGTRDIWTIVVMSEAARKIVDCTSPCIWADDPAWSPDGSKVLYESCVQQVQQTGRQCEGSLEVIGADGSDHRMIAAAPSSVRFHAPRWSPDGGRVTMEYDRYTGEASDAHQSSENIAVVDVASGATSVLYTGEGMSGNPSWSPDGAHLVFQRADATTDFELYTVAPDGGDLTRVTHLTENGGRVQQPSWTSDGSAIVATWEATLGRGDSRAALIDPVTGEAVAIGTFPATHVRVRP